MEKANKLNFFQGSHTKSIKWAGPFKIVALLFAVLMVVNVVAALWMLIEPTALGHDFVTNYNRALYWAVTTLTTIGYGDITPTSNYSRSFTMLVQISGVAFYGLFIAQVSKALWSRTFAIQKEMKN